MRRTHSIAGTLLLAGAAQLACAQSARPVKIIVPYGPGTGSDIMARVVAQHWAERTKQPVIVENRTGAGAIVGMTALKQAAPDGATVGIIVSANAAQPWLIKDIPFDIRRDFTPITLMYSGPLAMTVNPSVPASNLAEFVTYAKANAGKVFYGSLGVGTTTHLAAELLAQAAGIQITNVPYKGSGDMHTAVASGTVQMSFDNYVSPKPLVDAGRLRVIAVTSRERLAAIPQVPTLGETYPGVELNLWTGFAAPAGLPREVLDRLATDIRGAIQEPEVQKRIAATGANPGGGTPAEFTALIAGDYEKFGRIIRNAGIKPE